MNGRTAFLFVMSFGLLVAALFTACDSPRRISGTPNPGINQSPPAAPTNLRAVRVSEVEIQLTWRDHSENETGFDIFESIDSDAEFSHVRTTVIDVEEIVLGNRTLDHEYHFKVRAVNEFGASSFTGVALVLGGSIQLQIDTGDSPVLSVAYSPQGNYIIAGCGDFKVRRYGSFSGTLLQTLDVHSNLVEAVAYSPDSLRFASGSDDGTVKVWHTAHAHLEYALSSEYMGRVEKLEFSPDAQYLASSNNNVCIWDMSTGDLIKVIDPTITHGGSVQGFAYHPDGELMLVSTTSELQLWEIAGPDTAVKRQRILAGTIRYLAFDPDGEILCGTVGGQVWLWEIDWNDSLMFDSLTVFDHGGSLQDVAYSSDGRYVASASTDDYVKLWDAENYELLATLLAHDPAVYCLAFSNDSKFLVSGGGDTKLKIWRLFF